jgi:hypothetical protein
MMLLVDSGSALAFLITCSMKVTGLLVVTWMLAVAMRKQSAVLRHRAWAAGILGSLALPVFVPLLPAWHSAALAGAAVWGPAGEIAIQAKSGNFPAMVVNAIVVNAGAVSPLLGKLAAILWLIWLCGFLILALKLVGAAGAGIGAGEAAAKERLAASCRGIFSVAEYWPSRRGAAE